MVHKSAGEMRGVAECIAQAAKELREDAKERGGRHMGATIITKKFLLAGYEAPIDLGEDFGEAIEALRTKLRQNLHLIGQAGLSKRPIGFWTGDPSVDYSDARNHSNRMYFFGVEVVGADALPADLIVRDFPESAFAVFREERRGTASKWEWLKASGYRFNSSAIPGDFEIFDDLDHTAADCPCDVLVPIK